MMTDAPVIIFFVRSIRRGFESKSRPANARTGRGACLARCCKNRAPEQLQQIDYFRGRSSELRDPSPGTQKRNLSQPLPLLWRDLFPNGRGANPSRLLVQATRVA